MNTPPKPNWQYRGAFCGQQRGARRAAVGLTYASLILSVCFVGGVLLAAVPGSVRFDGRFCVFSCVTAVLAGYCALASRANTRHSRRLTARDTPGRPSQFALRDLLAITVWLAAVAGLTRWMALSGM